MKNQQEEAKVEVSIEPRVMEGAEEGTSNKGSSIKIKEITEAMCNAITAENMGILKQIAGIRIKL